jgi:hypothetical protein
MITLVNTMKSMELFAARFVPNIRQRLAENPQIDACADGITDRN